MRLAPINQAQPVNWSHPLNHGKVAWYLELSPLSGGGTLTDITNAKTTTFTGSPAWGNNFPFSDGNRSISTFSASDYVNTPGLSFAGDFTFSCWAYNLNPPGNQDGIIGKLNFITLSFRFGPISLYDNASGYVIYGTTTPPATWVHWAITRSGTSYAAYMYGRVDATSTAAAFTFNPDRLMSGFHGVTNTFQGYVGDVAYWNRALSAFEVLGLYNESLAGYPAMLNRLDSPIARFGPQGGPFPWYLDQSAMSGGLQTMGI